MLLLQASAEHFSPAGHCSPGSRLRVFFRHCTSSVSTITGLPNITCKYGVCTHSYVHTYIYTCMHRYTNISAMCLCPACICACILHVSVLVGAHVRASVRCAHLLRACACSPRECMLGIARAERTRACSHADAPVHTQYARNRMHLTHTFRQAA